jgi:hypothetical protein
MPLLAEVVVGGAAAVVEVRKGRLRRQQEVADSGVASLWERRLLRDDSLPGREDRGLVTILMSRTERSGRLIGPTGRPGLIPDEGKGHARQYSQAAEHL